tara:strand:+ start:2233 stop:2463 length:231 start_codon:yes stop_codon:yes gene_type:complete
MKFFKIINLKFFLLALFIGLIYMYFNDDRKKIIIYPTTSNFDKIEYKDRADNCFKYNLKEVKCPAKKTTIKNIPIQ